MAVSPETKGVFGIRWKGIVIIGRHLDTLNISGKTVMETDVINTYCLLLLIKWITLSMIEVSLEIIDKLFLQLLKLHLEWNGAFILDIPFFLFPIKYLI